MACTPPKKNHPWHRPIKGEKRRRKTPPQKARELRRVFVTLELNTDAPLAWLRSRATWSTMDVRNDTVRHCLQAQANVARK